MFWKGKVGWHIGEALSSSDSCIEEKVEVDGWMEGRVKKWTRMKPFRECCRAWIWHRRCREVNLGKLEMPENTSDGEIAVCLISELLWLHISHFRAGTWPAESPGILAGVHGVHTAYFLCFYLMKNVHVVAVAKKKKKNAQSNCLAQVRWGKSSVWCVAVWRNRQGKEACGLIPQDCRLVRLPRSDIL